MAVINDAVPVTATAMKLLDLRLKPSGSIISSALGEFTAPSCQEIAVLRAGGTIELYRFITDTDEDDDDSTRTLLKLITRMETRSVLRSCAVVRLTGSKRDILTVGADGGAISVLDFADGKGSVLHCATFGKTGTFFFGHFETACVLFFLKRRQVSDASHISPLLPLFFIMKKAQCIRNLQSYKVFFSVYVTDNPPFDVPCRSFCLKNIIFRMSSRHTRPISCFRSQRACCYDCLS